jgi:hypothetical protein
MFGAETIDNVDIGKTEIGIKEQNAPAHPLTRNGKITNDISFSHTALSTGDSNDFGAVCR